MSLPAGSRAVAWLETGTAPRIRSARRGDPLLIGGLVFIIGIDPHKGSHTAVAIDGDEQLVGELLVCADRRQRERLLCWAAPFEPRVWAVEGATGHGALLSQQLVSAGETVLDVPAALSARVRLLDSGRKDKTTPTMPVPPRSSRYGTATCDRLRSKTTARSCGSSPVDTIN
jgi:hypothetical protein